ncbi:MAG: hypothetical protein ACYC7L_01065 [Nitrospirota bacterium]
MLKTTKKSWLSYANLSDHYERKARFIPGLLSFLFLLPASAAFEDILSRWIETIVAGLGIGAVISVGISHLASAAGNRIQRSLWPRWPHDSPTNKWLLPSDTSRSEQQKTIWYSAIKRLTKLDVQRAIRSGDAGVESVINDAVSSIRYQLRNAKCADRLIVHNIDYGFARNFAGLRSIWVSFAFISLLVTAYSYYQLRGGLAWCLVSCGLLVFSLMLAFRILPNYVRQKADHYAESFFNAMLELDSSK